MAVQRRYLAKAAEAACLLASGKTYDAIAEQLNVNVKTIRAWMRDKEVQALFDNAVGDMLRSNYSKSINVIGKHLDRDKDPWLQQGAARIAKEMYSEANKAEVGDITIRFEAGQSMPEIGVPPPPDSE